MSPSLSFHSGEAARNVPKLINQERAEQTSEYHEESAGWFKNRTGESIFSHEAGLGMERGKALSG